MPNKKAGRIDDDLSAMNKKDESLLSISQIKQPSSSSIARLTAVRIGLKPKALPRQRKKKAIEIGAKFTATSVANISHNES